MNPLLALHDCGQSYWLDDLTRDMIRDGSLARRVQQEGLTGVTSNPSTFSHSLAGSRAYDEELAHWAREGKSAREIYELLATTDVRDACDVLRSAYDQTQGADGYVSLEVSPHLAYDSQASIAEAKRLFAEVNRPNVMIKIPGTAAAVSAIEELLWEGVNVNITLLFSVKRYKAVANAYLRAMERRRVAGRSLHDVVSVASFFLSRIDTLVDELLAQRIGPDSESPYTPHPQTLLGTVAIANAKVAYTSFLRQLKDSRWQALAAAGARPQRLLWASTSTKNPKYPELMYIEPLIGADSINTMPAKTIAAFADRGRVGATLQKGVKAAARTLQNLRLLHINLDHVAEQLESEGIQKFSKSYDETLRAIETKRSRQVELQQAPQVPIDAVARAARQLRRDVIRMTTAAGSGHPTSCMSAAEIVAALFFEQMRWDPADPHARNVDSFLLSKGHAAPILWAALAGAGAIHENLLTLRHFNSTLEGHPTPTNPWVRVATGSLGQGLCAANGMALANRLDGIDARIYCLLGDGECSEGSVWEAAQFAALNKLANVVAIVDQNALGQSAPTPLRDRPNVLAERFRAFGWHALEIDGHDLGAVREALRTTSKECPTAIIAHTVKGKGVSFIAGREGWHGKPLNREESARALQELGTDERYPVVEARRVGPAISEPQLRLTHVEPKYEPSEKVASRKAFGQALATLGEQLPQLVVFDADVMNSTYTELFAKRYPERFFESYIAEQNMVGTGLGLAVSGKIPVVATFACFLTRAYDFIRMAAHSRPKHFVFCGSHAGVSIGEDGPSQMGLEDIAMFRALGESTVLCPSDAVSAQHLTELAVHTPGIVYIRTARPATALLYDATDEFAIGGSKTLRSSQEDRLTLVATGIAVHSALSAHDQLRRQGVMARVIDAYSIKPLDVETLMQAARETERVMVIEDHWIDGGLGDAVAAALSGTAPVQRLAVSEEPRSGTMEELLEYHHISAHAICERVMAQRAH